MSAFFLAAEGSASRISGSRYLNHVRQFAASVQCSAGERVGPEAGSVSRIALLGMKVRSGKHGKSRRSIPILRYPILKQSRSARRGVSENMLATIPNLAVPEEPMIYKHLAEEGDGDHDEDGNASSVGDDSTTISH